MVVTDCHQYEFAYMKEVDLQRASALSEQTVAQRAAERPATLLICSLVSSVLWV